MFCGQLTRCCYVADCNPVTVKVDIYAFGMCALEVGITCHVSVIFSLLGGRSNVAIKFGVLSFYYDVDVNVAFGL